MSRPNETSIHLEWHKIRAVEGYRIKLRLPPWYAKRNPITTQDNHITITDLPTGTEIYVDLQAYKDNIYSDPFTIQVKPMGQGDEILHPSAQLEEGKNAVLVTWDPPQADRYKGKQLKYEVHYSNMIHRTNPYELSNDTTIVTSNNTVTIDNLHACEIYVFAVGLLGGPLNKTPEILTRPQQTAAVHNLRVNYDETKSEMKVMWEAGCSIYLGPVSFRLKITEQTRNKTSRFALTPSKKTNYAHLLKNVPVGGRYNICVHVAVEKAEERCVFFRSKELEAPSNVVAWLAPNGQVIVSWKDDPVHTNHNLKYQVIVSEKEIPVDLIHITEDMEVMTFDFSPSLLTAVSGANGPLYVGVRLVTPEGYYSDLSEVQTLDMEGAAAATGPVVAVSALWWGGCVAGALALALGGALLHAALRHRRLARSFLRLTAHTPRYDNRRGQATIGDHEDDDVPPIHGFSDDEPLVIA